MYVVYKANHKQFKLIERYLSLYFYQYKGDHYRVKVGKHSKPTIEFLDEIDCKLDENQTL